MQNCGHVKLHTDATRLQSDPIYISYCGTVRMFGKSCRFCESLSSRSI